MVNSNKTKVLQIVPSMETGGVERGVHDISAAKSDEFEIIVCSSGGKLAEIIKKKEVKHIELNLKSKNPINIFINIFKIKKIIKQEDIKIVHARSRAPAWSAYFASKLSKISYITTFHGFYKINNVFKKLYNSIMTKGDIVISVSHFMKEHIVKNYNISENKIRVIHRGIDMHEFDPLRISEEEVEHFLKSLEIYENKNSIVILPGRISRWKAQDTAIKALSLIEEDKRPVLLIIGSWKGKESFYKELVELAEELKVSKNVVFTGNLTNLPVAYAASCIGLNCSKEPETFGRVTAETGAMGRPVIASDLGGSREIVIENKTGSLFKVDDVEELSDKILYWIEYLSNDSNKEELAKVTRNHINDNFSLSQMCDHTFDVYREILSFRE